jgi:hypothetical protein
LFLTFVSFCFVTVSIFLLSSFVSSFIPSDRQPPTQLILTLSRPTRSFFSFLLIRYKSHFGFYIHHFHLPHSPSSHLIPPRIPSRTTFPSFQNPPKRFPRLRLIRFVIDST